MTSGSGNGDPDRGDRLHGRYRLVEELGRGGMGVVWLARDEALGRDVAVKEVRAPAGLDDHLVRQLYTRLEQEGRAAARVEHPNVITVYDVASEAGRPWIVMELVRGLSLADVLEAEGAMEPARAAVVCGAVLAALRAGHAAGVLHRDVKPGNVLIANDGRVVLTDFGIAVIEGSAAITRTGELVGSPEFLAPERALGRKPGPESDLFSLGVTLYAAVEGRSPFRRTTALTTLQAVVDEEPEVPRRAGPLSPVIEGLLRKDPAQRMGAEEAARLLDGVASGRAPSAGAGGPVGYIPTMRTDTPPGGAFGPPTGMTRTVTSRAGAGAGGRATGPHTPLSSPMPPPGGPGGPPPVVIGSPSGGGGGPAPRRGRARAAIVAGVALAALAAGGITWAAMDHGGGGGGPSANGARVSNSPSASASDSAGTQGSATDDHQKKQSESSGSQGNHSTVSTPLTVTIYLSAVRDSYSDTCPPPGDQAPYFRATVTVSRTPATLTFRWRTGTGHGTDLGWKTLDFPAGGPKSKTIEHVETYYVPGDTYHDWISVQVSRPSAVESTHVSFTTECTTDDSSTTSGSSSGTDTSGSDSSGADSSGSDGNAGSGTDAGTDAGSAAYGSAEEGAASATG
jgi:eukaryotic-like serine/threonine-protein kinase